MTSKKIWELEVKYEHPDYPFIWINDGIEIASTLGVWSRICYEHHGIKLMANKNNTFALINNGQMSVFDCKIEQYSDMSFAIIPL